MAEYKQPVSANAGKKITYVSSAQVLSLIQGNRMDIPLEAIIELSFLYIKEKELDALTVHIIPKAKTLRFEEQANGLDKDNLRKICIALPEGLLELEFGAGCNLCEVDPKDIADAFENIKSRLLFCGLEGAFRQAQDLDSSDDDDDDAAPPNRSTGPILMVIKALPASLEALNLGNNYLYKYSVEELMVMLSNLPSNISTLDLSENSLGSRCKALEFISKNIKTLNLSYNNVQQFTEFSFTLPQITQLCVSKEELDAMTQEQKIAFLKVFPKLKIEDIILVNDYEQLTKEESLSYFKNLMVSSLKSLCALSILSHKIPLDSKCLTEQAKSYLSRLANNRPT